MNEWKRVEDALIASAESDLQSHGGVDPVLVAFRGADLQFFAWLRPFEKGDYADPLLELCALAMTLSADRLALGMGGRLSSMHDPIPPVHEQGDLRQRSLVLNFVDATDGHVRAYDVLRPYDLDGSTVSWHDRMPLEGGQGWIHHTLQTCVEKRPSRPTSTNGIRRQARRVERLGHKLYVSPELMEQLSVSHVSAKARK